MTQFAIVANCVENNLWKFCKNILNYTENNLFKGVFFRRTLYA